jgi:hypothetical protein
MILSVTERLGVLGILPQEGNFVTMKILNELRLNLSYNEDEMKSWGIKVDEETLRITWDENGEAEIPIGEKATGIIIDELRKLDTQNKLTDQSAPIYEKFIPTIE